MKLNEYFCILLAWVKVGSYSRFHWLSYDSHFYTNVLYLIYKLSMQQKSTGIICMASCSVVNSIKAAATKQPHG